jgi:malate dehydrogenase
MVTAMKRITGFPKQRVVGQAGVLDSARYRTFVALELGLSVDSVSAIVLGGHGDDMVPVRSLCHAGGLQVEKLISGERLDAIEKRVRGAGGEIVNLLKTGSAFYSPAAAAIRMAEAYLFDKHRDPAVRRLSGRRVRRARWSTCRRPGQIGGAGREGHRGLRSAMTRRSARGVA